MQQEIIQIKQKTFTIPKKCLVIMPDYIGDCILLTAFLKNLRCNMLESSQLHICANKPIAEMLSTIDFIDNIFIKNKIIDITKFVNAHNYDTTILLDFSLKWQFHTCTSNASQKVVTDLKRLHTKSHIVLNNFFPHVLESTPINDKAPQIEVYLDYLKQLGLQIYEKKLELPITESDTKKALKLLNKNTKRKVFLHLSASIQSKKWIDNYWEEVINYLQNDDVYVIGNEKPPKNLLKKNVTNLCNKTNLRQTIALLEHANILITTDSAPAHLASIAKTPNIIVLYGPTNFYQWKPHCPTSRIIQLYADVPCRPCKMRKCQSLKCIKNLKPKMVIEAINEIKNAFPSS